MSSSLHGWFSSECILKFKYSSKNNASVNWRWCFSTHAAEGRDSTVPLLSHTKPGNPSTQHFMLLTRYTNCLVLLLVTLRASRREIVSLRGGFLTSCEYEVWHCDFLKLKLL